MGTNRNSIRRVSRIILAAALSLTAVASAKAFEVTAEQRAACTPDAFRLCSSEIPDVNKIVACMKAKEASLSPPCRTVFQTASLNRPLPSHQRTAHRIGSTYASNQAAPSSSLGHRHSRQALRALASHGHRMYRMGSTHVGYQAPPSLPGGRWTRAQEEREALIIGRKVMMGYAMACQNHSIPAELCNLSEDSSVGMHYGSSRGAGYQGAWGSMPSMESSPAAGGSTEHGSVAGPTNNPELESFLSSFVTR